MKDNKLGCFGIFIVGAVFYGVIGPFSTLGYAAWSIVFSVLIIAAIVLLFVWPKKIKVEETKKQVETIMLIIVICLSVISCIICITLVNNEADIRKAQREREYKKRIEEQIKGSSSSNSKSKSNNVKTNKTKSNYYSNINKSKNNSSSTNKSKSNNSYSSNYYSKSRKKTYDLNSEAQRDFDDYDDDFYDDADREEFWEDLYDHEEEGEFGDWY